MANADDGVDVVLREVHPDDLPSLFVHQLDPEATRMAAFPSRDREAFMAHWRANILSNDGVMSRTILVDGEVAGHVVAFELDSELEVGYWVAREHWGKGVATRALAQFLAQMTRRPLFAHVARHNVGSLRVLEKCGFTVLRHGTGMVRGQPVDELLLMLSDHAAG
jgi:RimJ/RimL family protein N-acetyltransferase